MEDKEKQPMSVHAIRKKSEKVIAASIEIE